jgi:4-hydroxy-3-methylbut-2-enyl diphosphate reductase
MVLRMGLYVILSAMARKFDTHDLYRSSIISRVKRVRHEKDPLKRDLSPAVLDFGPVRFILARHFGFCFGVENAIDIAYETLAAHPDERVYFLSEMIHNPKVNGDLRERGVRFIFTPGGEQLVPWDELGPDDIVVVPAFGTALEMQQELAERGIDAYKYNTTCPFVEKVWKRSAELGQNGFTVVVHGKATHEETRATFSHSVAGTPTVVVLDLDEARILSDIVRGDAGVEIFEEHFGSKCSDGFDPERDLRRIGVVNQTTMLATETREIARLLRQALVDRFGGENIVEHFADTSDTLCYATNENQHATYALIERGADLALVVGGYNSSNTSHIARLCARAMPTYFIEGEDEIISSSVIHHFSLENRVVVTTEGWLPEGRRLDIVLTCGASCPDVTLESVLLRVLSFYSPNARTVEDVLERYASAMDATGDFP